MFTGIIEEMGIIQKIEYISPGARLSLKLPPLYSQLHIGQSLAINGCCLTLINWQLPIATFDVVEETLIKTNFLELKPGDKVNIERALSNHHRLDGHLVQGHVDGIGKIIEKNQLPDGSWWLTIAAPSQIFRYLIKKGSIAVDGISLTIAKTESSTFSVALIPHTSQFTTLGFKKIGDSVNLEVDMIAKYIERMTTPYKEGFSSD